MRCPCGRHTLEWLAANADSIHHFDCRHSPCDCGVPEWIRRTSKAGSPPNPGMPTNHRKHRPSSDGASS